MPIKICMKPDKDIIKKTKIKKNKFNLNKSNINWNSKIINNVLNKKTLINFKGVSIDSKKIKKQNLFRCY